MKKVGIIVMAVVLIIGIGAVVYATNIENDPIITLSYFEKKIDKLKNEIENIIDEKVKNIDKTELNTNTNNYKYEIVTIKKNKQIVFNESTEFIVRRGTAKIIDPSKSNGIPNLTTGKDNQNGETAGLQNLYLVPRSDGRGISAETDLVIMIRGSYTVK